MCVEDPSRDVVGDMHSGDQLDRALDRTAIEYHKHSWLEECLNGGGLRTSRRATRQALRLHSTEAVAAL